jgi:hypothetical protein
METITQTQPESTRQVWITPQVYDLNAEETESGFPSAVELLRTGLPYGPSPS